MNEIGGKRNSGEGGEDGCGYELEKDGSNKRSGIKQVASGRFGVRSDYVEEGREIEMKVGEGGKGGEGGELGGWKVYGWIGERRG